LQRFLLYVQTPEARCIKDCQEERERLLDLKRKRGQELVSMSVQHIEKLWIELGFSREKCVHPEEVTQFLISGDIDSQADDSVVDHVLVVCQEEIDRLLALQKQIKPILHNIQEREKLLIEREEFRQEIQQPNRFQHASRMLAEEKKRNKFEKTLPMLEKTLAAMIRKWNEVHHERFMYCGVDYLQKMEDEARADKEREEARKKQRAQKRLREAGLDPDDEVLKAYGNTVGKNKNLMAQTLSSTMKMVHPQKDDAPQHPRNVAMDITLPSRAVEQENLPPLYDMGRTLAPGEKLPDAVRRTGHPLSTIQRGPTRLL